VTEHPVTWVAAPGGGGMSAESGEQGEFCGRGMATGIVEMAKYALGARITGMITMIGIQMSGILPQSFVRGQWSALGFLEEVRRCHVTPAACQVAGYTAV
jgi:hypothetical protein